MPKESEAELRAKFTKRAKESSKLLDEIIEYWFTNNYRSLKLASSGPIQRAETRKVVAEKTVEIKAMVERHIAKEVTVRFLSLTMPNGKPLSDCTKTECREFSAKMGPWLAAVANRTRAGKSVADCLTEQQVSDLYKNMVPIPRPRSAS